MTTKEWKIQAGSDDAECSDAVFRVGWWQLGFWDFLKAYRYGLRFTNVTIPQGATILSAHLKLCGSHDSPIATKLGTFKGYATDNVATFSSCADIDAAKTSAFVQWVAGAWTKDVWYSSPDLASIIQEIVNRPGWASGNALAVFWDGPKDVDKAVYAFEQGDGSLAPRLEITWTPPPSPAPAGRGVLRVNAIAGEDEVAASVEIQGVDTYDTPFSKYLDPGEYSLVATYNEQRRTDTITITEGESSSVTFSFSLSYTLMITSDPSPIDFTLNGSEVATPFSERLLSDTYTIVFPASVWVGVDKYIFSQWENGLTTPTRTLTLDRDYNQGLVATYVLKQIEGAAPASQRQIKDALREVVGREGDISQENPLPTQVEPGISIFNGQETVDTPGTVVPIGSGACISVDLIAFEGNAGTIWVGNSGVTPTNGRPLYPGATLAIDINDVSKVYIDADNADDGVGWIALRKRT